jgi:hypothetical protein
MRQSRAGIAQGLGGGGRMRARSGTVSAAGASAPERAGTGTDLEECPIPDVTVWLLLSAIAV